METIHDCRIIVLTDMLYRSNVMVNIDVIRMLIVGSSSHQTVSQFNWMSPYHSCKHIKPTEPALFLVKMLQMNFISE